MTSKPRRCDARRPGQHGPARRFVPAALAIACLLGSLPAVGTAVAVAAPVDDFNVALTLYRKARWEAAAETFAAFVTENPRHPRAGSAALYRGLSLVNLGRHAEARRGLENFLRAYPKHPYAPDAMYRVGECSYYLDELERADAELTGFVKRHPRHPLVEWAMPYAADAQLRLGRPEDAIKLFTASLRQFPKGRLVEDARFGMARAAAALGRDEQARRLDLAIVEGGGSYAARSLDALAASDFDAGRFESAAATFDRVLKDFPESPVAASARLNAGFAYYRLGRYADAARRFRRAVSDPDSGGTAVVWLGMSLEAAGDTAAAVEAYTAALESNAPDGLKAEAALRWGDASIAAGDYAAAVARYDAAVDYAAGTKLAAEAGARATRAVLAAGDTAGAETRARQTVAAIEALGDDAGDGLVWRHRLTMARILDTQAAEAEPGSDAAARLADDTAEAYRTVATRSPVPDVARRARLRWTAFLEAAGRFEEAVDAAAPLLEDFFSDDPGRVAASNDAYEILVIAARANLAVDDPAEAYRLAARYRELVPAEARSEDAAVVFAVSAAAAGYAEDSVRAWAGVLSADVSAEAARPAARRLAETAFERGMFGLSARLFRDELALIGEDGDPSLAASALSGLGWALMEGGEEEAASAEFAKLARFDETKLTPAASDLVVEAAHLVGRCFEQAGELEQARDAYADAFERFAPDEAPRRGAEADGPLRYAYLSGLQAARLARRLDDDDRADATYSAVADAFAESDSLDKLLDEWAVLHYEDGRYARADDLFRRLAEARPDSELADDALLSVAEGELIAGDLETAAVTLASLSGTDDGGVVTADAAVRQRAGYLLVAAEVTAGDWDGVRDAGGRFLEKYADAPEAAEVAYRVADAELRAGETRSAAARAERLLTDAPPAARSTEWFARVPLVVAEASRRDGDVETVLATLADVRKSNAHPAVRAEAEQIVGQALLKKARFEEARAAFRRALETPEIRLTATAARAEYGLAQTYFLKQQWRAASTSAFRAYSLYDLGEIRAPALLMVARCDEAVGERTKAIAAYNDVCSEFPDTEFAREASSRLAQLTE